MRLDKVTDPSAPAPAAPACPEVSTVDLHSGGKNAKKRAVVAVARKLAVVMHRLWISGETYVPLFNSLQTAAA